MNQKIEKITVERVFNIGNYQTIRFGLEVSVEGCETQQDITRAYHTGLNAVETAFNDIMTERKRQEEQRVNREYARYAQERVNEAKREMRTFTE